MEQRGTHEGFTLIEMAVVLVIIGLIVGGILVGRDMVNAARVRAVLKEKEQYITAAVTFREKYGYLPGDYPSASSMFSGCVNNGNNHCDGNANGIIGEQVAPYYGEACRFWEHLNRAKLLSNTTGPYATSNSGLCAASEVPTSAYSEIASWFMTYCVGSATSWLPTCAAGSNYFVLSSVNMFGRTMSGSTQTVSIISPANALMMDRKVDDGNPITGSVIAGNTGTAVLSSAPFAAQNLYCLYSPTPYAVPIAYSSWSYYTTYKSDANGCTVGFLARLP